MLRPKNADQCFVIAPEPVILTSRAIILPELAEINVSPWPLSAEQELKLESRLAVRD